MNEGGGCPRCAAVISAVQTRINLFFECWKRTGRSGCPSRAGWTSLAGVALSPRASGAVLGISEPTAKRHWAYARAWLFQEIERLRASG
jgi:hypothetical protein